MTALREAAQQMLDALEGGADSWRLVGPAIDALKAALAEPQTTHSADCYKWHHECAVAEVERLRAALAEPLQEPVAWRTFDGEGGYDYRTYDDNENYAAEWALRNPLRAEWVEPLYTAPLQRLAEPVQKLDRAECDGGTCGLGGHCGQCPKAEPVQEPVAFVNAYHLQGLTLGQYGHAEIYAANSVWRIPLYTAAPTPRKPEQEPVAWIPKWAHDRLTGQLGAIADPVKWGVDAPLYVRPTNDTVPLYTAPPQRKPLSEEEIRRIYETHRASVPLYYAIARAIERAHGIGGQDE